MKNVKRLLLGAACAASLSATAFAQQAAPADHGAHHPQGVAKAAAAEMTEGEVRKVDKSAGKITLKHGEIKSLDMPPMTMVFGVKDAAMLDQVKAGDKVRFAASNQDGKFTVTEILATK
jgi:Cu/Ag efflux protein CusF